MEFGLQDLSKEVEADLTPTDVRRIDVIEKYILIAKRYYDIDVVRKITTEHTCLNCKYNLDNAVCSPDAIVYCPQCSLEAPYYDNVISTDDIEPTGRNDYVQRENFKKAGIRFQGKQNLPIDIESIFAKMDDHCFKKGIPSREFVLTQPVNSKGYRGATDIPFIKSILKGIDRPDLFDDVNLIGKLYYGWQLIDLSSLDDTLMDHYDATQKVFDETDIEIRQRSSALGTGFRLYKHLQLLGVPCEIEQFNIAEMRDSQENQEALWKRMTEGTGRDDIWYIPT